AGAQRAVDDDVVAVAVDAVVEHPAAGDQADLRGFGVAVDLVGRELALAHLLHALDHERGSAAVLPLDDDLVASLQLAQPEEDARPATTVHVPEQHGRADFTGRRAVAVPRGLQDRKSTRLNSSHVKISYAVFC